MRNQENISAISQRLTVSKLCSKSSWRELVNPIFDWPCATCEQEHRTPRPDLCRYLTGTRWQFSPMVVSGVRRKACGDFRSGASSPRPSVTPLATHPTRRTRRLAQGRRATPRPCVSCPKRDTMRGRNVSVWKVVNFVVETGQLRVSNKQICVSLHVASSNPSSRTTERAHGANANVFLIDLGRVARKVFCQALQHPKPRRLIEC